MSESGRLPAPVNGGDGLASEPHWIAWTILDAHHGSGENVRVYRIGIRLAGVVIGTLSRDGAVRLKGGRCTFAERPSFFGRVAESRLKDSVGRDLPPNRSVNAVNSGQCSNSLAVDANRFYYFDPFLQSTAHSTR